MHLKGFAWNCQVFEVGRHSEATKTLKKGVKHSEELTWGDDLEVELDNSNADQELHVRNSSFLNFSSHSSTIFYAHLLSGQGLMWGGELKLELDGAADQELHERRVFFHQRFRIC